MGKGRLPDASVREAGDGAEFDADASVREAGDGAEFSANASVREAGDGAEFSANASPAGAPPLQSLQHLGPQPRTR